MDNKLGLYKENTTRNEENIRKIVIDRVNVMSIEEKRPHLRSL